MRRGVKFTKEEKENDVVKLEGMRLMLLRTHFLYHYSNHGIIWTLQCCNERFKIKENKVSTIHG